MAASIQFDSTEILNTTYVPRFVKHESAAERMIASLPVAREDGEAFIDEHYGTKSIVLQGIITGTTQALLEDQIDTMKELFSRTEKNLDIDWNGSTRRYVASCVKHEFNRDHFNLKFCPWTAEFRVLSGEGKGTSTTTARNAVVIQLTSGPGTDSFDEAGSKPAKPKITIEMGSTTTKVKGIQYKNTDTGEKIVVTRTDSSWFQADQIIIDCLLKKVTEDIASDHFTEGKFYGVFPRFAIGTNNVEITGGGIVNQSTSDTVTGDSTTGDTLDATTKRKAQSFIVPYTDATFKGITLMLEKTGTPGNMTVRIETDNAGKPSGTLADANATFTITAVSVTSKAYYTKYSTNLWTLSGNTRYWIVISAAATLNGSNYYTVYGVVADKGLDYQNGKAMTSADSGGTYADWSDPDFVFRIRYGGEPDTFSVKHTVVYTKTYL
jgi:hypothetical protein